MGKKRRRGPPNSFSTTSRQKAVALAESGIFPLLVEDGVYWFPIGSKLPKAPPKGLSTVSLPRVRTSSAPTLASAAPAFGVSVRTLSDWVAVGVIRAVIDDDDVVHIPALHQQVRDYIHRLPSAKKRAKKKRRAKKSKRPTRPPPITREPGSPPYYGPPLEKPKPPPRVPTAAEPMDIDAAASEVGQMMRQYVMARLAVDREATYQQYRAYKHAFRTTYGERAWRDAFEWIVDDLDLEPYIFDREALRDS